MLHSLKNRRTVISCALVALGLISAIAGFEAVAKVSDKADVETIAANAGSRRVALVIANADYPDASAPIRGTMTDARNLAQSLQARGFEVDFEENVSKAKMDEAVERFVNDVKPGTTALVSFSGYGIQVAHENYLIPTDARIWKENDVRREGTNVSALLDRVTARGGDLTIAILDASRRNPFERRFRSVSAGLVSVETARATLVLSTVSPGRTLDDVDGQDRAIPALVAELNGQPRDAETLFNRTKQQVSLNTKGDQVPFVSSSLVDGFTF